MNLQEFEDSVRRVIKNEIMVTRVLGVASEGLELLPQHLSQNDSSSYYAHCYQLLEDSSFDLSLFKQQMSLQNSLVRRVYCDYAKDRVNQEHSKWLQRMVEMEGKVKEILKDVTIKTFDDKHIPEDSNLYHDIAFACIRYYEYPKECYVDEYELCQDEIAFCKLLGSLNDGFQVEKCTIKDTDGNSFKMSSDRFIGVFVQEFMPFFKERHFMTTSINELEKISKAFKYERGKITNRLIRELVHVFVKYHILKDNSGNSYQFDSYHLDNGFNPEITYAANPILDIMFQMGYMERGSRFDTNVQPGLLRKEYKDRIEEALKAQTLQCVFDLQANDMFNTFLFT